MHMTLALRSLKLRELLLRSTLSSMADAERVCIDALFSLSAQHQVFKIETMSNNICSTIGAGRQTFAMEGIKSIFEISKDVVHLSLSAAVFCITITINFSKTLTRFLYNVIYCQTKSLFRSFMWLPVCIIVSILLQLVFLPINIPLRLLASTSVKAIIGHAYVKTNTYVITTLLQYSLVLIIFGLMIGLVCGAILSFLDFLIVIPDLKFDISLSSITKFLPFGNKINSKPLSNLLKMFHAEELKQEDTYLPTPSPSIILPGRELEELLAKTRTTPYRPSQKNAWHRRSSSSKESVLEAASKLPSDFFQRKSSMSEERQQIYQTPVHSPSNRTTDDSSYNSSNMWDQFDELPSTLRTDGEASTLHSRKPVGVLNKGEILYNAKVKNRN